MRKEPFVQSTDSLFTISAFPFKEEGLTVGMTSRLGGKGSFPYDSLNMASYTGDFPEIVRENRQIIVNQIGIPITNWIETEQVHGCEVRKIDASHLQETSIGKADAIYTKDKGILLTSYYADCVPMFFYAPHHHLVGLAHAGWKGTALNIGEKLLKDWQQREGVSTDNVYVVIGPSISMQSYEVDERVINKMKQILPEDAEEPWYTKNNDRFQLDLKQMNCLLLKEAGVANDHILVSQFCTYKEDSLFFSYRRDQGITGRMMTFIGLK